MKSRVHGIRWYEFEPKAIHHMSYNERTRQLALSRCEQSIEIWKFEKEALYLDRVIQLGKDASIEALVWCQNRLFSIGLNGFLIEYDLLKLKEKNSIPTSFGGCWCMVPNHGQSCLAVGTEDGYITIYKFKDDKVEFDRKFEKHEGRIICLSWHISGDYIVTGSVNSISVWDTRLGKSIRKIKTQTQNKDIVMLCVAITSDLQVISGDSTGRISFWDGLKGVLIQSMQSHQAEILCLNFIELDGKQECYVSGVDPQIVKFQRKASGKKEWIKGVILRIHTHDVRCLLYVNPFLVSGGVDSYLTLTQYPPNITVKFPPVSPMSYLQVATAVNCVLLQYPSHVELWQLGKTDQISDENHKSLTLSSDPQLLLELKAPKKDVVVCSAVSCDAKWLAYSTDTALKLYHIQLDNMSSAKPAVSLKKLKCSLKSTEPSVALKFISDCNKLISLCHSGKLQIFAVQPPDFILTFEFVSNKTSNGCHLLSVSDEGDYAAVADHDGHINIFNLKDYTAVCTLPRCSTQATAMEFVPNTAFLTIAYQNRNICEFDVERNKFSNVVGKLSLIKKSEKSKLVPDFSIRGITFSPEDIFSFLLHDDVNVYHVNREVLKNKSNDSEENDTELPTGVKSCSFYKHLLHFVHLQGDYMIAMEITPLSLQKKLPPQLMLKQFGT